MAAMTTSAAITIPSFTGLKAGKCVQAMRLSTALPVPMAVIQASLKEVGVAVTATAASAMLTSSALAIEVLLGGNDGSLAFVPSEFSVAAGFPHNVVFDEDEVPAGVDVSKISMAEDDLLNGPGEVYAITLSIKGTYGFYCSPHQGAGMVGKVTVN